MNDDKKPATWSDVRRELVEDGDEAAIAGHRERLEAALDHHHTRWADLRQQRIDQVGEEVYNGLVRQAAKEMEEEMQGLRRLPYCDGEACEPDGATVNHSRDCSIVNEYDGGEE